MLFRSIIAVCGLFASSLVFGGEASVEGYAVVVSQATKSDPAWSEVVEALVAKHEGAEVLVWKEDVGESLDALRQTHPRYACFVATSAEAGREFLSLIHISEPPRR